MDIFHQVVGKLSQPISPIEAKKIGFFFKFLQDLERLVPTPIQDKESLSALIHILLSYPFSTYVDTTIMEAQIARFLAHQTQL